MEPLDTTVLDSIPERSKKRIVDHFGLKRAAEWVMETNYLYRPTPAEFIANKGEGYFLDSSCDWPIEDTGRFPYVITKGASTSDT